MKELTHASVAELSALLSKKEVSAKEIAQAYLDKIEDKKSLNAFLDVRPEVTLKEAEAADRKIAEGTASPAFPLHTKISLSRAIGRAPPRAKCSKTT
jgi:aspartyl-tRNA(Asn)/glutamyl-tRNA(Gln) amidotransferase subunit A